MNELFDRSKDGHVATRFYNSVDQETKMESKLQ